MTINRESAVNFKGDRTGTLSKNADYCNPWISSPLRGTEMSASTVSGGVDLREIQTWNEHAVRRNRAGLQNWELCESSGQLSMAIGEKGENPFSAAVAQINAHRLAPAEISTW